MFMGALSPRKGDRMVKRGDMVKIDGKVYKVTMVEYYGFFVQGKSRIILHTDKYELVKGAQAPGKGNRHDRGKKI